MAIDYQKMQVTADRLLVGNGRAAVLVKINRTVADPAQPWRGNNTTETTLNVTAVFVGIKAADVDGDLIRRGDQFAIVSGLDAGSEDLRTYDALRENGQEWKILDVEQFRPGASGAPAVEYTLAFKLHLRK